MKSKHLLFFLATYIFLFFILFPGYRFIMDPDSTGYFSVAEQLAKGDFHNSINGIWSPLGSWILTPFLQFSFDEILTAKYLNGFYGFLSLIAFFYFIVAHLPLAIFLAERKDSKNRINLDFIKKTSVALIVLFTTVVVWIIALNSKYGHYTLGQQNITGSLSPAYNQPRVPFYPPPFTNAYSVFDDITYLKLTDITPFTNGNLFFYQVKLIFFNSIKTIEHFNDFSFAFIIIILIGAFLFFGKYKSFLNQTNNLLLLSFIVVWPLGFLFLHVEPRYLWIMILAVLALAGILLSYLMDNYFFKKKYISLFSLLIIGSFYLYPLIQLKDQYGTNKNYFEIAAALKQNNIEGNILCSNQGIEDFSKAVIINFLLKCRHYGPFTTDYTTQEVLHAIKKYDINYFILYYYSPYQKEILLSSTLALNATIIFRDIYPGIIVLAFNKER